MCYNTIIESRKERETALRLLCLCFVHENLQQHGACAGKAAATAPRIAAYKAPPPAEMPAFFIQLPPTHFLLQGNEIF